jgi:hypothetical protein
MEISNNKISHLISSQVPFFVRGDHQTFVRFIEAYYEYLEQDQKAVNFSKNILHQQNIDKTIDEFAQELYKTFLTSIPSEIITDKKVLMKHIKDFYRARGTEKSARFLMRILFNDEIDIYYPKKDVLRVSDGKWYVQRSLRVTDTKIDDVMDNSLLTLEKYIGTIVTGLTSGARALVERTDRSFEQGTIVDELVLSNIDGEFLNAEDITATYYGSTTQQLRSTIFGGILSSIIITNPGAGYSVGDPAVIISNSGNGACAVVASVSSGNVSTITVIQGGAGYQVNDPVIITGGGGFGANAKVAAVLDDNSVHPNTYSIINSTIQLEANTPINNTVYSNLNSSNANTSIANSVTYFVYANTGPASAIFVVSEGQNYATKPTLSIASNTFIQSYGILGRMEIENPGQNYQIGDLIEFINVPGGFGLGANGMVSNVDSSRVNAITEVRFTETPGQIIGGSGYSMEFLPRANVVSATGNGANIVVTAILGSGAQMVSSNTTLGAIQRIAIINKGLNYAEPPILDLSGSGNGTATATARIIEGVYEYEGRYLNDDGQVSSYNFLQDRDYYQNFSYVIKARRSIERYRQAFKSLVHPSGMKMWGEVGRIDNGHCTRHSGDSLDPVYSPFILERYLLEDGTSKILLEDGRPLALEEPY